jgi:hypothetical protein
VPLPNLAIRRRVLWLTDYNKSIGFLSRDYFNPLRTTKARDSQKRHLQLSDHHSQPQDSANQTEDVASK